MGWEVIQGDCLEKLQEMPDQSVDAIITDPPYGLSNHSLKEVVACLSAWINGEIYQPSGKGFLDNSWDAWVPGPEIWKEALRVLKPGGHLLAFAGTRSMDLMSMSIRLAGFELRDSIGYAHDSGGAPLLAWCQGMGFPKSIDVGSRMENPDDRNQWQGWGTALKPAWEPIMLARKPIEQSVIKNILNHGTGGLNIEASRVGERFPANVIHDGSKDVMDSFPESPSKSRPERVKRNYCRTSGDSNTFTFTHDTENKEKHLWDEERQDWYYPVICRYGDGGSASRFFYCSRIRAADREEGCENLPRKTPGECTGRKEGSPDLNNPRSGAQWKMAKQNHHPTVKPTNLMRYLVRLVTPPGGVVLDPFCGSGSTGKAAILEGFNFIGIEKEPEYVAIARARISHTANQGIQKELFCSSEYLNSRSTIEKEK